MSGWWASMWLSYLSTNNFMFSIWSKTNLKNQNTAELSVLAEWSKTPISQIQSLMFECFIRSFHFYISKFKEKACNRLKCFIQPELMLFCFSYYSSQILYLHGTFGAAWLCRMVLWGNLFGELLHSPASWSHLRLILASKTAWDLRRHTSCYLNTVKLNILFSWSIINVSILINIWGVFVFNQTLSIYAAN